MQNDKAVTKNKNHFALCLKEFKIATLSTMIYILLSCAISYFLGYNKAAEDITLIWGIPSWIVLGVIIPWLIMVSFTVYYGFVVMEGDEE